MACQRLSTHLMTIGFLVLHIQAAIERKFIQKKRW